MNLLYIKIKEVGKSLIPVIILVLLLSFTIVSVESDVIIRFIVGSVMLLIGLSIFLWGVDLSMNPIGEYMSKEVATSKSFSVITILSFLLGFLVTVAEPDLLILGSQIEDASGGTIDSTMIVYVISVGVGIMISLGVWRLLSDNKLNVFMAITYGVIFILAIFVSEEFLAISFDASGATTGALTTPFVLALSLGLSTIKGGNSAEENSFGLVGIMSAGPILSVMLVSILSGQKNIQGEPIEFIIEKGVIEPILLELPAVFLESFIALIPITALFFIFNYKKFKIPKDELIGIVRGLVLVLLGLVLFLTAVHSGFMDMGRILGMEIAKMNGWVLVAVGFVLGFIVVLVEPAVHVLGEQIEEVTAGYIPMRLIKTTLSIGVALSISLSMVRILVPAVKLWYFIIPGFIIAIILSFISDPIFVGVAFDAGGVASGPLTATFVLAFAQGAASSIETANVLVDGFGIIAMVATAPVLAIMILGTIFKHKKVEYSSMELKDYTNQNRNKDLSMQHDCIIVIVNRGLAEKVVDISRKVGATGATMLHGRGIDESHKVTLPIFNIEVQSEKDIILLITNTAVSTQVADYLLMDSQLVEEGEVLTYICHTDAIVKQLSIS